MKPTGQSSSTPVQPHCETLAPPPAAKGNHTNVVQTIDNPGTIFSTIPMGINKAGTVVGGNWSIGQTGTFSEGGWVWTSGTFRALNPGGSTNGTCCQSANGISNNGLFAGQVFLHDFWQSWFKAGKDADFWQFKVGDTFGTALDNSADVTGYSSGNGAWFAQHIEANEGTGDQESK